MSIHHDSQILIVDDSASVRSIIRKILTQLGYKNIDEASDGGDALAKIAEKQFDLVISDWNMEPMDGRALLEKVRAIEKYAKLPFIIMTADPAINKIVQAKNARVSSFINKPFTAESLKAKISEINTV
jgi:two-component system, chemotaxis family, chemotaxis protein CheY